MLLSHDPINFPPSIPWRIIASDGTVDDLDDTSLEFCRDVAQAFASVRMSVRFVRVPVAHVVGMPYI